MLDITLPFVYNMNERSFICWVDMVPPKTARGEKKRRQIVQAAHKLFIQQGFHATSMRQIANEAEIALGGLYNHFASKEAVFEAVFREYHPYKEVLPNLLNIQAVESIEGFVRQAMHQITEVVARRPDFLNLFFIELVEFRSTHVQMLVDETLPLIEGLIERLRRTQSEPLRPIPLRMVILAFWGMVIGYYFTHLVLLRAEILSSPDETADQFVDIFLHGVLQP